MSVDSKVPEIRFEGFGGEWGQDNISNIAPLQRGFDLPKNSIKVGAHPVVMSNGVNCFHNEFRAKAPGVVTGRSGTIGNIHYIDVDYWPHNTSLWVTNFHKNVPLFIYYLYVKLDLKRFGTGSGVPTLNRNDVHVQSVALPKDSKEQAAIGNYFQKLDTLINQHQQKHDKLSNIKKSMLEKMFPKQGKTIPEIRFKGFTGEWEEKILNNEVGLFSGLTYSPSDIRKSGTLVLRSSNVKNGQIIEADNIYVNPEVVNCSNVVEGDIIVVVRNGSRSLIGKHAQVTSRMNNTVIGAFMTGIRCKQPAFINALLDTNMFTSEVEKNLGATINQITNGSFKSMFFMFPTEDEQQEIGNYFQKLDALINQHQQQINKLNNIKQACLSKMFV
ncbi:restriction endonuclease subunit S [Serratia marcescens]|uniref:restriction endonuclease subunit S n=1 Tax=Serratia marcescens TaxID=615 RepID=UPI0018D74C23|nr:restriction endonuclease subunit S [Serratia marcescens]MBK5604327.1 restriction endonuclease subunit S [Serratia marcescens]